MNALVSTLTPFFPGSDGIIGSINDLTSSASQAGDFFGGFLRTGICGTADGTPFASIGENVRFEVGVDRVTGLPTSDGFGCDTSQEDLFDRNLGSSLRNVNGRRPIRPDLILAPPNIVSRLTEFQNERDGVIQRSYSVVEFKLSAGTVYNDVVVSDRFGRDDNQVRGLVNYARTSTQFRRFVTFVTLFDRNRRSPNATVLEAQVNKVLAQRYRAYGIILSLTNRTNNITR